MPNQGRLLPISQLLAILEQVGPASPLFSGAANLLHGHLLPKRSDIPEATSRRPERFLTIGMATYDDYDGVYFSVQAIRLYHPEVTPQTEILVIDNHPEGASAGPLKQLESQVEGYRYVPYTSHRGTAVRDLLFREATGHFVLAMDSHVQFAPGALARLVEFLGERPDSNDLWQGPLLADDLRALWSHFSLVWSDGMYGQWGVDGRASDPDADPFEIGMQGLGVFVCRRAAWPGFNPRFSGFGGEEGYIHEKIRRAGGRVFCLPFLRWIHRFNRPPGVPYRPVWRERIRNYLLGHDELGLDPRPVKEHFESALGTTEAAPLIAAAERELAGPFQYFDAVYSIHRRDSPERWRAVDLDAKIRFLPAPETPFSNEIGCALAHRRIIEEAERQKLASVLIFDEDFVPSETAVEQLRGAVDSLRQDQWSVRRLPGAVAYHSSGFRRLLSKLPAAPSGVALWLRRGHSLEVLQARMEHGCGQSGVYQGFGVTVLGQRISVLTDCRAASAFLNRYLAPWLPRSEPEPDAADLNFRVLRSKGDLFQAYAGEVSIASDSGLPVIFEMLQGLIEEKVVHSLPNLVVVHAGVVVWNGHAALLPGASQSGKTTLVAELLKRGAGYYSDEYALLDKEGRVHAYPRALMLRNSGGWRQPVLPSPWPAGAAHPPAQVRLILSLEWAPGGKWNAAPIGQSEALLLLLRNTPHEIANRPDIRGPLRRAVSSASCHSGVRGEAEEAADHIVELLAELR